MDVCIVEQNVISLTLYHLQRALIWFFSIAFIILTGEAVDGTIAIEDLIFTLNFLLPCAALAALYLGLAVVTNNFGQELRLIWNGAQLQYEDYQQTQIFLPSLLRMLKCDGRLNATLTLYLHHTDRPRKLSLEGLPAVRCHELVNRLNEQLNTASLRTPSAAPIVRKTSLA